MKNPRFQLENCCTFCKIVGGKHAGAYGYIESIHDWKGGAYGVISGKENGERFECLVFPSDAETSLTDEEVALAKQAAINFYMYDVYAKSEYVAKLNENAKENEKEIEFVLGLIYERAGKWNDLLTA